MGGFFFFIKKSGGQPRGMFPIGIYSAPLFVVGVDSRPVPDFRFRPPPFRICLSDMRNPGNILSLPHPHMPNSPHSTSPISFWRHFSGGFPVPHNPIPENVRGWALGWRGERGVLLSSIGVLEGGITGKSPCGGGAEEQERGTV